MSNKSWTFTTASRPAFRIFIRSGTGDAAATKAAQFSPDSDDLLGVAATALGVAQGDISRLQLAVPRSEMLADLETAADISQLAANDVVVVTRRVPPIALLRAATTTAELTAALEALLAQADLAERVPKDDMMAAAVGRKDALGKSTWTPEVAQLYGQVLKRY